MLNQPRALFTGKIFEKGGERVKRRRETYGCVADSPGEDCDRVRGFVFPRLLVPLCDEIMAFWRCR
jgi:hypothetical protein